LGSGGTIRAGLTFHGLRKSLGKKAADLGFSENDIAAALGIYRLMRAGYFEAKAARSAGGSGLTRN
jgi:hypothetical protein